MVWSRSRLRLLAWRGSRTHDGGPSLSEAASRQILADVYASLAAGNHDPIMAQRMAAGALAMWNADGRWDPPEDYTPPEVEIAAAEARLRALADNGVLTPAQADQLQAALAAVDTPTQQSMLASNQLYGTDSATEPAPELESDVGLDL